MSAYFGGKSKIAVEVWKLLGNVQNYVEPFFGSGAVLLLRPDPPKVETVNDLDSMVANFWRATQADPESVAAHADGPVNEADLHARHRWLVLSDDAAAFRQRMKTEPDYFDVKIAGWWCWGLCCWIGTGWCVEPDTVCNGPNGGSGKRGPQLAGTGGGNGVTARSVPRGGRPQLADAYDIGRGVNASALAGFALSQQVPLLRANAAGFIGSGVNMELSALDTCAVRRAWLVDWFSRLRDRLRLVRVCCGDWSRVCSSESVTTRLGITGVFLDPPYGEAAKRSKKIYAQDSATVAGDVLAWCLENGSRKDMRIVLAGYSGEHESLEASGWSVTEWEANGGYGNRSDVGKANAKKERLWSSPHCCRERTLFDVVERKGG